MGNLIRMNHNNKTLYYFKLFL
uniref:Uncharacterized protein n=1 Tax=Heterorhabditis bacteriophora TaxID=37862 RepID=A0A1I7WFC3_HETBA